MTISFDVGGTENYIARVGAILRARYGIELDVCLIKRSGPLIAAAEASGIPVFGTSFEDSLWPMPIAAARAAADLARLIRRRRYDVVQSYLFLADVISTSAARLAGTRRIIVSRRAVHPWRRPAGLVYKALETGSNALAGELIANSRAVLHDAERTEWLLPARRSVVYNGVDAGHYEVAHPGQSRRVRLVTVGALAERKGHEYGLEALSLIRRRGIDAVLTLVGAGPLEERLRRAAATLSMTEFVTFAGLQVDPRPHLQAADVFVLPSRQEGFSNAILEAMASGLPIVATDVGGNAEAVVDGDGGFIVAPGDAPAIAAAIIRCLDANGGLAAMGAFNRARVEQIFSLDASAALMARWYSENGHRSS